MCGITGIFAFNGIKPFDVANTWRATDALASRGPDARGVYHDDRVGLGHRRLSIIDTSRAANQPMWDASGRYCIVFNGEIYNYIELRKGLKNLGVEFRTQSDTEVLLQLLVRQGKDALHRLNGFFSFAFYDRLDGSLFLARDRFGIKPLVYYHGEGEFLFASEIKALLCYGVEKALNYEALFLYLQLNYVPAPNTMLKGIHKLLPGYSLRVTPGGLILERWYKLSRNMKKPSKCYEERKARLTDLLDASVRRRLVADVPLGAFLSGGVDSSVIAALAARQKTRLHSFSIGFSDEPFFDETKYARLVARKIGTDHTVFSLTNRDLYQHLDEILDYFDEPFADSSAIAVYILSCETRKYSTVALSGDGADEMFAGYNKHMAFYRAHNPGISEKAIESLRPIWLLLPKSRSNWYTNFFRQIQRFSEGLCQEPIERYWHWASVLDEKDAVQLLSEASKRKIVKDSYLAERNQLLSILRDTGDAGSVNDILCQDFHMVLPNDMLTKVDLMSMANSLEVRVPFLDHEVVEYVFSLSEDDKIGKKIRKKILRDAFCDLLPQELYKRPKRGFEVPLLGWFRNEMRSRIVNDLLSDVFVADQGIFSLPSIRMLKRRLFSASPGDAHAQVWALVVFQSWWRSYMA